MAVTIELEDQAVAAFEVIRRRAVAAGEPLARYLTAIIDRSSVQAAVVRLLGRQPLPVAEMRERLDAMARDLPGVPLLPAEVSRKDIFSDHDRPAFDVTYLPDTGTLVRLFHKADPQHPAIDGAVDLLNRRGEPL